MVDEQKGFKRPGDVQKFLRLLAIATAILFLISAGLGIFGYLANKHRISDIQDSRISSCERTYLAFKQVYAPFLPPPDLRTPKQKHDIAIFYRLITNLRHQCDIQTSVPVGN